MRARERERKSSASRNMGAHCPCIHTSLECELWPLSVLRQSRRCTLYSWYTGTSPSGEKTTRGKKHSYQTAVSLLSFKNVQNKQTILNLAIHNSLTISMYMAKFSYKRDTFFVNILPFRFSVLMSSTCVMIGIPNVYKVKQIVRKASFLSLSKEQPLEHQC